MCRGKIVFVCIFAAIAVAGLARAEDPPEFILAWGGEGSDPGEFLYPNGLAVDQQGHVYVADTGNRRVQKFTSGGVFLREWGEEGTGDGQFMSPIDVAIDSEGDVWVMDRWLYGDRIQKFDTEGTHLLTIGVDIRASEGIGAWDTVYNVDYPGGTIIGYTLDGVPTSSWGTTNSSATDIAVGIDGTVFVSEQYEHWFSDRTWISVFTADGTLITVAETSDVSGSLNRLTVDGLHAVYATAREHKVVKFNDLGLFQLEWGEQGSGDGQFEEPCGVAVDGIGNVYVADRGNNRIQKFGDLGDAFECVGFAAPMDRGPVTPSPNRVLPFKAQLLDGGGDPVTDLDISSPPRIEVMGDSGVLGNPEPPLEELPPGAATEGNEFEYNPATGLWVYHLRASDYTSTGTYTVKMESGDTSEYVINPTCTAEFVIE